MSDNAVYSFTFCRIDSLAIGVLLSVLAPKLSTKSSQQIGIYGAALLLVILLTLTNSDWRFKSLIWLQTLGYSTISIAVAMIMLWVLNAQKNSVLLKLLESHWLLAIGRASYSLYIWHLVFFPYILKFVRSNVGGAASQYMTTLAVSVTCTTIFGLISYRWCELNFSRSKSILGISPAPIKS